MFGGTAGQPAVVTYSVSSLKTWWCQAFERHAGAGTRVAILHLEAIALSPLWPRLRRSSSGAGANKKTATPPAPCGSRHTPPVSMIRSSQRNGLTGLDVLRRLPTLKSMGSPFCPTNSNQSYTMPARVAAGAALRLLLGRRSGTLAVAAVLGPDAAARVGPALVRRRASAPVPGEPFFARGRRSSGVQARACRPRRKP